MPSSPHALLQGSSGHLCCQRTTAHAVAGLTFEQEGVLGVHAVSPSLSFSLALRLRFSVSLSLSRSVFLGLTLSLSLFPSCPVFCMSAYASLSLSLPSLYLSHKLFFCLCVVFFCFLSLSLSPRLSVYSMSLCVSCMPLFLSRSLSLSLSLSLLSLPVSLYKGTESLPISISTSLCVSPCVFLFPHLLSLSLSLPTSLGLAALHLHCQRLPANPLLPNLSVFRLCSASLCGCLLSLSQE